MNNEKRDNSGNDKKEATGALAPIEKELDERIKKYEKLTGTALKSVKICVEKDSFLFLIAVDFLEMAWNYFNDAGYFEKNNKKLLALASYSYAHAWIDAGLRMGLFERKKNKNVFGIID